MKGFLIVFALMVCMNVTGQDYTFGKVSKEELLEKFNPNDSSAAATYLYKYRKSYFEYVSGQGFQLYTLIHERIKIYNKEGFDYATKKINLYQNASAREKVGLLKANTFNLVDGKVESVKLKKDGEFETELNKYNIQRSFTLPNIKEGTVVEYKYRIISPFLSNVDEFILQNDIPIKKLEAVMEAPEYFNFRVNMKGFLSVAPKMDKGNGKATVQTRENVTQGRTVGSVNGGGRTTLRTSNFDYATEIYKYDLSNVPALIEEPYVNSIDNYRSGVKYELSFVKFPSSPPKYYSTTWEDVVKTIYESSNFGSELEKTGYYKNELSTILDATKNEDERVQLIFDFVKSKVKWNGFYSKFTSAGGVRKAYKEQKGNSAEINLMLTSMLRKAGMDANPVLLSTRKNGIPLFPTRDGYNYVICGVRQSDGILLLDASSEFSAPNILPFRTLNWEGRLIEKDGKSSLVNLYPAKKSSSKIYVNNILEENGDLSGKIRFIHNDHSALDYRNKYLNTNQEDFLTEEEKKYDGIEIEEFTTKNEREYNKPLIASYDFYKEDAFEKIGDRIYISPLFFLETSTNPFKLEKREYPIDFGYPSVRNIISSIKIPDSYRIESLPEPVVLMLPDDLGKVVYTIKEQNPTTVQLRISKEMNMAIIPPTYYDTLKDYYKKMIEKMNEKVVLSKISDDGNSESTTGGR